MEAFVTLFVIGFVIFIIVASVNGKQIVDKTERRCPKCRQMTSKKRYSGFKSKANYRSIYYFTCDCGHVFEAEV